MKRDILKLEDDALYLNQELLVEIKTLIEEINDSNLYTLRQCVTLIHDINKGTNGHII